ncbi:S41 family peptidase [bacterium]|nr:S41 family peptidase [bacterium]
MKKLPGKNKTALILIALFCAVSTGATLRYYDSVRDIITTLKIFNEVFQRIQEDYVEETVGTELIQDAITGMISELDPHSRYLKPDYFSKFNQDYAGYSGIGITFDVIRNKITVMSVIPEGPSDRAGLMVGDRIVAINGESAVGLDKDEAPRYLMGPQGTKVTVGVDRAGFTQPREFTIIRDKVHVESIPYAFILRPGLGYIGIIRFSSTTGSELKKHLLDLTSKGMKELILDLRHNGGGYLDASAEVADRFLSKGKKIVYTKGRTSDSFREFYSSDELTFTDLPMIVMIDRFSASASEIVSGALQDWDRALVVGETSFGKGLVQSQYRFRDGSALFMTTARYYTPIGRQIQRPYDTMSLEDYYTQIVDDSLRRQWENDPARPTYTTKLLRRRVKGGGGITPDIFITAEPDTVSDVVRALVRHPQRLFFTFIEDYLNGNSKPTISLTSFLREYQPEPAMLQKFLGYIRETGFQISDQEYSASRRDIQYFLKQSLADQIWGDEARYKVQLLRDEQLIEALTYLPQAHRLLQAAY